MINMYNFTGADNELFLTLTLCREDIGLIQKGFIRTWISLLSVLGMEIWYGDKGSIDYISVVEPV